MLLFMNQCNDFAPCGPSIGQQNSYSYSGIYIYIYTLINIVPEDLQQQ